MSSRLDLLPTTTEGKLAHVEEEMGEVIQALGKIRRFGEVATDSRTGIQYDNLTDLQLELCQLRECIDRYLDDFK
jgi:hypothetical protein